MTNDERMPNDEIACGWAIVIRASSLIRHSSLVIRHFALLLDRQ
jgi:hypothetical protein